VPSSSTAPLRCLRGSLSYPGRYCGARPDNHREVDSTGHDQSKDAGRSGLERVAKKRRDPMVKRIFFGTLCLTLLSWVLISQGFAQEDKLVQVAIDTFKSQFRLPKEAEVKFIEKKESPIPGFQSVKLTVLLPNREIPYIVYVDSKAEMVILGNLIIKGENVSRKEAGGAK